MKKYIPIFAIILIFVVGVGILVYPLVSSAINNYNMRNEAEIKVEEGGEEEAPAEECCCAEEAPAEEAPAEECCCAEEAPAEEAPSEEAPAEE